MITGRAQQIHGHGLGLFPLVLSWISIAAPLNCMHLSHFYQEIAAYLIIGHFFNGPEL